MNLWVPAAHLFNWIPAYSMRERQITRGWGNWMAWVHVQSNYVLFFAL